jgi:predicted metal-dependent hydrolase
MYPYHVELLSDLPVHVGESRSRFLIAAKQYETAKQYLKNKDPKYPGLSKDPEFQDILSQIYDQLYPQADVPYSPEYDGLDLHKSVCVYILFN